METTTARDLYDAISLLDTNNHGEPWDDLTEMQQARAMRVIEAHLPPVNVSSEIERLQAIIAAYAVQRTVHIGWPRKSGKIGVRCGCAFPAIVARDTPAAESYGGNVCPGCLAVDADTDAGVVSVGANKGETPSGQPFAIVGTGEARLVIEEFRQAATDLADLADEDPGRDRDIEGDAAILLDVLAYRDHLAAQVTELQASNTALLTRARAVEWRLAGMSARLNGKAINSCLYTECLNETAIWRSGWSTVDNALSGALTGRRAADKTTIGALRDGALFDVNGIVAAKTEYTNVAGDRMVVLLASGEFGHLNGLKSHDDVECREIVLAPQERVTVTLVRREDDWQACLDPSRWEAGRDALVALGSLMISRARELNVNIVWPNAFECGA